MGMIMLAAFLAGFAAMTGYFIGWAMGYRQSENKWLKAFYGHELDGQLRIDKEGK
jgi:hypothetical protein